MKRCVHDRFTYDFIANQNPNKQASEQASNEASKQASKQVFGFEFIPSL
jgi:hypothetical protein